MKYLKSDSDKAFDEDQIISLEKSATFNKDLKQDYDTNMLRKRKTPMESNE